jgi:N-acetylneuraminate synthase/N,N'-diacetyllegionaminate synthase
MKIDDNKIPDSVYFIAEAGINHNGDMEMAREMIEVASDAGADAVKFQTFSADRLVSPDAPSAEYQETESQHEMLKEHELSRDDHVELMEYCERVDITFLSTPFDEESLELLDELGVPAIKMGSGELNNYPLLEKAASLGRPMIVSTGMGTMEEVEEAFQRIREVDDELTLVFLHCVSAYPTEIEDLNLRAIETMKDKLQTPVGFSDHTTETETPGLAVAAGATVVEKHFTLDSSLPGPDHEASLEPDELEEAVRIARNAARALGDGEKKPVGSELKNKSVIRKSIHAARRIDEGKVLSEDDISVIRPEGGLPPAKLSSLIGKEASETVNKGEPITEDVLIQDNL